MVVLLHNYLMNVLQEIFRDNYEIIQYTLHPRDVVMESIDKMINCGDPSFGGAMFGCTHCGNLKFVPFRCHSKFCPSCGAKYCNDRATAMSFKLIKCHHRHCVFTIDEELRHFFLEDRSLLNCLFSAVRSVVLNMFYKANKSKTLFQVLFVYYILSDAPSNGIPIFIVLLLRVDSLTMVFGEM